MADREPFKQKPGKFSLFKVSEKSNERSPDYTGSITLEDGTMLRLAGWLTVSRSGAKYIDGRVDKDDRPRRPAASPPAPPASPKPRVADDDIPF